MRATLHGRVAGRAAAVVGTFDPFLPDHRMLLEQVSADARRTGLGSVAILLDPPPAMFVHDARSWPLYDDCATRLQVVRENSPVDALLLVRFSRRDADTTAAEFLQLVCASLRLGELWLGVTQSLGRGPDGNADAIARVARRRRFRIRRLDPHRLASSEVRASLSAGRLEEAIAVVGRPPVRRRPRGTLLRLGWAEGRYEALGSTARGEALGRVPVEIREHDDGAPVLEWPDRRIARLAFVRGPGDGVAET